MTPAVPSTVVVDATVGTKWVVYAEHSDKSIYLLDRRLALVVPDLFLLEVANTLGKKVARGEMDLEPARQRYVDLSNAPFEIRPSLPLVNLAFDLSASTGRTLYDSIYLAMAISLGAKYATADARYARGLSQARPDLRHYVLWVGDIPRWLETVIGGNGAGG